MPWFVARKSYLDCCLLFWGDKEARERREREGGRVREYGGATVEVGAVVVET
uniref:Uncharacterized protein n=1 Tax=Arundo donax TaxID=35708 RepID=A0A0A8ZZL8_ARUDO